MTEFRKSKPVDMLSCSRSLDTKTHSEHGILKELKPVVMSEISGTCGPTCKP